MTRVLIFLSIAVMVGCRDGASTSLESHESQNYGFTRFIDSIGSFPYTAEATKISRVKAGFSRLAVGMGKDAVRRSMGEPDAEFVHYKPTAAVKDLVYTTWAYYLKRFEREQFNEGFDQAVVLYFKPNDELYWADPDGVEGLRPIGAPDLHPEGMAKVKK